MSHSNDLANFKFDMPKHQSNVIKVIGVGGGGSNAINHMFNEGIKGVDFVVCNTDSQALENSPVPNKIQLGVSLTEGLGAGANPEIGEQAALESMEDVKIMLGQQTKMAFITAGMGGGTGTGAAPIIAKYARELNILTVGIVTTPFNFEGEMRLKQAQIGIEKLRANVDSLIIINNNKLREVYGNLGYKTGFSKADEVLSTAAKGIAEVITKHYVQNIDLRDAKTVLANSGTAIMGSAAATGPNRAEQAIISALDSPLLNDNKIYGAKNVLLLIVSGTEEITLDEIGEINDRIQAEAGHKANIIMGIGEDLELGESVFVTVIATGFAKDQQDSIVNADPKKVVHNLDENQPLYHHFGMGRTMEFPSKINKESQVIRHHLEDNDLNSKPNEKDVLIPTTPEIRSFHVFYEEVIPPVVQESLVTHEDDFIIIESKEVLNDFEVIDAIEVQPPKPMVEDLNFDFPIKKEVAEEEDAANTVIFDLSDSIKNIRVNQYEEITPKTKVGADRDAEYDLHQYLAFEDTLTKAAPLTMPKKNEVDEELRMEKGMQQTHASATPHTSDPQTPDPENSTIKEMLQKRVKERREKLKDFNHNFGNRGGSIDQLEKQPAYLRKGITLEQPNHDQKVSRTSLGSDSNDELQVRTNNSFLHDNVD